MHRFRAVHKPWAIQLLDQRDAVALEDRWEFRRAIQFCRARAAGCRLAAIRHRRRESLGSGLGTEVRVDVTLADKSTAICAAPHRRRGVNFSIFSSRPIDDLKKEVQFLSRASNNTNLNHPAADQRTPYGDEGES